jgi:hypothetical protein
MAHLTIAEKLVEAETALHELLTGTSARVVVDQNGERVEYTAANAPRLRAYIEELKRTLSAPNLGSNGPLRAVF